MDISNLDDIMPFSGQQPKITVAMVITGCLVAIALVYIVTHLIKIQGLVFVVFAIRQNTPTPSSFIKTVSNKVNIRD